ncbi:MAG: hypothetical protein ACRCS8_00320 [Brevinema sp.]
MDPHEKMLDALDYLSNIYEVSEEKLLAFFMLGVNHLFSKLQIETPKKELKDFALCIYCVVRFDFFHISLYSLIHHTNHKDHKQKLKRQHQKINGLINKLLKELKSLQSEKSENHQHDESEIIESLSKYKKEMNKTDLLITYDAITDVRFNRIYSQKILTDTGSRDLLARLLSVTFQVNFYEQYMDHKFEFAKLIYAFVHTLILDKYQNNLTENELYKLIKDIDIKNLDQMFAGTFIEVNKPSFKHYFDWDDTDKTNPFVSIWKDNNLSYVKIKKFSDDQLQKSNDYIVSTNDDLF